MLSEAAHSVADTVTEVLPDPAGDVTSLRTLTTRADATATDTQCFGYDQFRYLVQAWTPGSNDCGAALSGSGLGGPAAYWTSYGVDPASGNRTQTVQHSTTGGADTTYAYAYPAAGQPHPHAVLSVTYSGGATGTDSYGAPDADGNTLTRPGQTLAYDARGKLGSVTLTANGKQQTSIYDAEGNVLVQSDPVNGTTAFLGDTQLRQAAGATAVTASRTYTANGQTVAERDTTAGVSGSTLYFLDPDPLGTATVEVRATDGKITRRYTDPYGNPRGPAAAWSSPRGYLNAPASSFSGLTQLGARAYDPWTGRFVAPDPILDVNDPGSLATYAYADNNPVTNSDPSGLLCTNGPDGSCVTAKGNMAVPGVTDRQGGYDAAGHPSDAYGGFVFHRSRPSTQPAGPAIDPHDVTLTFNAPTNSYACAKYGSDCWQKQTITLYDLMNARPDPQPKNYCGSWSWLCTLVGYNQIRNCFANPSVGECLDAVISVASDIFIAGKAIKAADLAAKGVAASIGSRAGKETPDLVRLYRAVEPGELEDILNTGVYRTPAGGVEGKYFFPTRAQAENFAGMMEKIGQGPYCISSGCIPASALRGISPIHVGSEGTAYLIPNELLPYFDSIVVHGPK